MSNILLFLYQIYYNEYGENDMNDRDSIILSVLTTEDLTKLENNSNIKYINLNLSNPNRDVIAYFIEKGQGYFYSDIVMGKNGYIYADYDTFAQGERKLSKILDSIPNDLTSLEKARYLYLNLGNLVGFDINTILEKNLDYDYYYVNELNNIWFALSNSKCINSSLTKIYLYLCERCNISNEIILLNSYDYKVNRITLDDKDNFIADPTKDLANIEANFQTKHFGAYNIDRKMDQKLGYIANDYNDIKLDLILKKLDYKDEELLKNILNKSGEILDIRKIKPIELGMIYDNLFQKYFSGNKFNINNLYLHDLAKKKEHFLLISDGRKYYSFNYRNNAFLEINKEALKEELTSGRVGIYQNEYFPSKGNILQK